VARAGPRVRAARLRPGIDVELDLVAVWVAHAERAGRLAERCEPVGIDPPARGAELRERAPDVEGDVVQARHALGLCSGAFRARQLARDVVVMDAGGEEDDAPALARAGLGEPEDIAVEMSGRLEVADEEGDVTELADLETGAGCVHGDE